jgi:hypothetical protein
MNCVNSYLTCDTMPLKLGRQGVWRVVECSNNWWIRETTKDSSIFPNFPTFPTPCLKSNTSLPIWNICSYNNFLTKIDHIVTVVSDPRILSYSNLRPTPILSPTLLVVPDYISDFPYVRLQYLSYHILLRDGFPFQGNPIWKKKV